MLFLLPLVITKQLINSNPGNATISFDEGPSKNIPKIIEILKESNTPATFYFNAFKTDKKAVNSVLSNGHVIGISITDDFTDLTIEEVEKIIQSNLDTFIVNTGIKPKLCRLPRLGFTEQHVILAEKNGLKVTKPNLDSEDCDLNDFLVPFTRFIESLEPDQSSLSIVFRDRMSLTVRCLQEAIDVIYDNGFEIVKACEFYKMSSLYEKVCPLKIKELKEKIENEEMSQMQEFIEMMNINILKESQDELKDSIKNKSKEETSNLNNNGSLSEKEEDTNKMEQEKNIQNEDSKKEDLNSQKDNNKTELLNRNEKNETEFNKGENDLNANKTKDESNTDKSINNEKKDSKTTENELTDILKDDKTVKAAVNNPDTANKNENTAKDNNTDAENNTRTDTKDNVKNDTKNTVDNKKSFASSFTLYLAMPLLIASIL
ncbi:hypothetical protein GVAV_002899 [Gurleya vavrai]